MKIKTLQENELPNLSNDVKNYLKKGFWSLIEANDKIIAFTEQLDIVKLFKNDNYQIVS